MRRPAVLLVMLPLVAGCQLWSADHETGGTGAWTGDGWGLISISSTATVAESTTVAHSGSRSLALTIVGADGVGTSPGVRLVRNGASGKPLPNDAYYSAWYYFPQIVDVDGFWNVYQWKRKHGPTLASDPTWTVNVSNRADGGLRFSLKSFIKTDGMYSPGQHTSVRHSTLAVEPARWVHLECRYRWSYLADGQVTCWQDGTQIFDATNVITEYRYAEFLRARQWTANNYADRTTPTTHTLYVDDAIISTSRTGPGT